jgi:hypothetical protein
VEPRLSADSADDKQATDEDIEYCWLKALQNAMQESLENQRNLLNLYTLHRLTANGRLS